MKDLKLTTWQRVQLLRCIPPTAPTIEDVGKHLRVAGVLELTEKEKEFVGWEEARAVSPTGELGTSTVWAQDKADHIFEISLEDADFKHLRVLMAQRRDWPVSPLTLVLHDNIKRVMDKTSPEKEPHLGPEIDEI